MVPYKSFDTTAFASGNRTGRTVSDRLFVFGVRGICPASEGLYEQVISKRMETEHAGSDKLSKTLHIDTKEADFSRFLLQSSFLLFLCENTLWSGGCNLLSALNHGTPAEVCDHCRRRIEIFSKDDGFVFKQEHSILTDILPEIILAMYRAGKGEV